MLKDKTNVSAGHGSSAMHIYIPEHMLYDSAFPLDREGCKVWFGREVGDPSVYVYEHFGGTGTINGVISLQGELEPFTVRSPGTIGAARLRVPYSSNFPFKVGDELAISIEKQTPGRLKLKKISE